MGTLEDRVKGIKESFKPDKESFKQKFKKSFFAGSKRIGSFAKKQSTEFVKSQFEFQKQKTKIARKEKLKAFRRDVRAGLQRKTQTRQIQSRQIQQRQIQPQPIPIQTFPDLLGSNNNKDKKPRIFF